MKKKSLGKNWWQKSVMKMRKWDTKRALMIGLIVVLFLGLGGYYIYAHVLTPASINKVSTKQKDSKPKDVGPKTPMPRATAKATPKASAKAVPTAKPKWTPKPSPVCSQGYYDMSGKYVPPSCIDSNMP